MKKIALFPGCFDPFHRQHLEIIKAVLQKKEIAQIIILINGTSEEKTLVLPFHHRYTMVKNNLENLSKKIKVYEQRIGFYTTELVKKMRKASPDQQFTLILGTDQINNLPNWKNAENLNELVDFIAVERKGYPLKTEIQKKFNIEILKNIKSNDFNSTAIKKGENWNYLTPTTLHYLQEKRLYYGEILEQNLSEKRQKHCYATAELARQITSFYRFRKISKKVCFAALMHDLTKEWKAEKHLQFWKKHSLNINLLKKTPLPVWHSWTSAHYLERELCFDDRDIIQAIHEHTTANAKMNDVGKIIFVADKLEPNKKNPETNSLRKLLFQKEISFDVVFEKVIVYVYQKLLKENKKPTSETLAAYRYYHEKNK